MTGWLTTMDLFVSSALRSPLSSRSDIKRVEHTKNARPINQTKRLGIDRLLIVDHHKKDVVDRQIRVHFSSFVIYDSRKYLVD